MEKDKERQLDDKNKFWFEETAVGQDKDKQILERGGGGNGTLPLQCIKVPTILEIEISRDGALERVTRERSLKIEIS